MPVRIVWPIGQITHAADSSKQIIAHSKRGEQPANRVLPCYQKHGPVDSALKDAEESNIARHVTWPSTRSYFEPSATCRHPLICSWCLLTAGWCNWNIRTVPGEMNLSSLLVSMVLNLAIAFSQTEWQVATEGKIQRCGTCLTKEPGMDPWSSWFAPRMIDRFSPHCQSSISYLTI